MRKFKLVEPKHDIKGMKFIMEALKMRIPLSKRAEEPVKKKRKYNKKK